LIDNVVPHIPDSVNQEATMQITLTKSGPGGEGPPPEPSDDDAVLDPIIEFVQFERDAANIQNKVAKDLIADLNDLKQLFADVDPSACTELQALSVTVTAIPPNKIDSNTRSDLLVELGAAEGTKGCPP